MGQSRRIYFNKRKLFLKNSLIALTLFGLGVLTYAPFHFVVERSLGAYNIDPSVFATLLMACLCVFIYRPLDFLYTELFKRLLFRKHSYTHLMLMKLAEELELELDLQEAGNLTVNTFGELLRLKNVALFVNEDKKSKYVVQAAYGWPISEWRKVELSENSAMIRCIVKQGSHVLVRNSALKAFDWTEANRLSSDFDLVRASWVIPLWVKEELIGFLAFSAHEPDRSFDRTDFLFFRRFSRSIARKIRNASLFESLKKENSVLQDSQSKLMQISKIAAIEQLATGLAHQIHNPLTIISGKSQVLLLKKSQIGLDEHVEGVLQTIVDQTKRASDITKKLLMFSQGHRENEESISINQVLEDTLALISYQVSLEDVSIVRSMAEDLPCVRSNIQEMREIFFNLLLNAVQSIGENGKVRIETKLSEEEGFVEVVISDNGKGIPKEEIDKLFNPFYSTRHEAVGLGLFVTKQIVHRMGGVIRVESSLSEGSLFTVILPYEGNMHSESLDLGTGVVEDIKPAVH